MSIKFSLVRQPGATVEPWLWDQTAWLWDLALPYLLLNLGESLNFWESWSLCSNMGTTQISLLLCVTMYPLLTLLGMTRPQSRGYRL